MPVSINLCLFIILLIAFFHHALSQTSTVYSKGSNPYLIAHNNDICNLDADCKGKNKNCLNGQCIQICNESTDCEFTHCNGKVLYTSSDQTTRSINTSNSNLGQYLAGKRCSWLLRNLDSGKFKDLTLNPLVYEFPPFIQLEVHEFSTNFGNDYLYIFDGDSVYSPLIAAISGEAVSTPDPVTVNTHILTNKAYAIDFFNTSNIFLLFKSDIYSYHDSIPSLDLKKPSGIYINYRFSASCTDQLITNVQNTICYNPVQDNDNITNSSDFIFTKDITIKVTTVKYYPPESSLMDSVIRRAFHTSFVYKNFNYILGGYSFKTRTVTQSFMSRLDLSNSIWEHDLSEKNRHINQKSKIYGLFESMYTESPIPEARYAHSSVVDTVTGEVFMYGGVKYQEASGKQVTNELWKYDLENNLWTLLNEDLVVEQNYADSKKYVLPVAVSGHSMCLVSNDDGSRSLLVFFGFSEYYGSTLNIVQEYNLVTKTWSLHNTLTLDVNIGFAHTASYDLSTKQVFFHGGLTIGNRPNNSKNKSAQFSFDFKSVDEFSHKFKTYLFDLNPKKGESPSKEIPQGANHLNFDPEPYMSNTLYKYDLIRRIWTTLPASCYSTYMHSSLLYKSSLLVFGGIVVNSSRDESSQPKVSNSLRIFNTESNQWLPIELSFKHRHRYAHSSFVYKNSLFIFAGFNGFFLQDLFKIDLSPLNLDKNDDSTLMNNNSSKSQNNKKKPSSASRQSSQLFLGIIELCNVYSSCSTCQANINCIWNRQKCQYYSATSLSATIPSPHVIYKKPICLLMCPELGSCNNCTVNPECIWCATQRTCILRSAVQAYFPFGECIEYISVQAKCPHIPKPPSKQSVSSTFQETSLLSRQFDRPLALLYSSCRIHYSNCSACIMDEKCGWCSSDIFNRSLSLNGKNNTGAGQCMEGAYSRSKDDMCRLNWYFTECPMCECNGHATCEINTQNSQVNNICGECRNNTEGLACDQCTKGFYGFAENNGTCTSCDCGRHSDICDNRSGLCLCNTKGVVGNRCDRCETPRYTGLPALPDGTCYYNLSTDYQFTFNLNKATDRFYTRINFVNSIEENTDDDIDFMIRCFKSDALFNVTFVVDFKPEESAGIDLEWPFNLLNNITNYIFYKNHTDYFLSSNKNKNLDFYFGSQISQSVILAQVNCTSVGERHTFSNVRFRNKQNATFIVHVYDFEVPVNIQVSFSRRSRIQLLHFFITFFGCLFSLLTAAFLAWKIKQRYDLYSHRRQVVIQMEHMASRPFTKLMIDVSKMDNESVDESLLMRKGKMELGDRERDLLEVKKDSRRFSKLCGGVNKKKLKKHSESLNYNEDSFNGVSEETTFRLADVMPVAVEPLSNNKTAIVTCVLRLPQGGLKHTPKGSSPLVLASTYVHCDSSSSFTRPQQETNNDSIMLDDEDGSRADKTTENV